jgi:hypothetical protein
MDVVLKALLAILQVGGALFLLYGLKLAVVDFLPTFNLERRKSLWSKLLPH